MNDRRIPPVALSLAFGPGSPVPARLLELLGDAETVWEQTPFSLAFKTGLREKRAAFLKKRKHYFSLAAKHLEEAAETGVRLLLFQDKEYPKLLRYIANPPSLLYVAGDLRLLSGECMAVVGTRHASAEAMIRTRRLASQAAAGGKVVVSGMARGVDTAAHRGALDAASGGTAAVLGCGIDVLYPVSNRRLREDIRKRGVLVSEFPPGREPRRAYFPMRNRIISGLATEVVVVEAPARSGALITAMAALEQGRDVRVCGWERETARNAGIFRLLAEGAPLYPEGVADVPASFDDLDEPEQEAKILRFLQRGPASLVRMLFELASSPEEVVPDLVRLELRGRIRFRDGVWWPAEMSSF